MATDAELVAGLRRGEAAAFDAAHAAHGPAIYRFLARLACRRDLADDLYQETWLRLVRHAPRLADDTDLRAWLFTVARNAHRSWRRWSVLDAERLRALHLWPRRAAGPSPLDQTEAATTAAALEAGIAALPAAQREVLLLVVVEGFGCDEVAAMLGIAHDAARQRLARARARLRQQLEQAAAPRAGGST